MTTHELTTDDCHYTWSREYEAQLRISPGDTVHFSTRDGFDGQLSSLPSGPLSEGALPVDMSRVAPLTGPIYVEGVVPGDTLEVEILELNVAGDGWVMIWPSWCQFDYHRPAAVPDSGYLRRVAFTEMLTGSIRVGPFDVGLKPMLGMVGTAPAHGEFVTSSPHDFGGNLDCRLVCAGSTLRLPVFVEGALLSLGDGHAVQGDGELCTTAVECPLEGTIRIQVDRMRSIQGPELVSNGKHSVLAHGRTLDAASRTAIERMCNYLTSSRGMQPDEAYMALSLTGNLSINQVVNPYVGVRLSMPDQKGSYL